MKKYPDRKNMGTIKKNSLLNPNIHVVKFPDGEIKSYAEKMTAKICIFRLIQIVTHTP